MASSIYLQLTDIKGDSVESGHVDWFEVNSFQWALSNPVAVSSTGLSGGKSSFSSVTFSKNFDQGTPVCANALCGGKHIATATIHFMKQGDGASVQYAEVILTDVLISNIALSAGGSDSIISEMISLDYKKIEIKNYTQDNKGKATVKGQFAWDQSKNKA